MNPSLPLLVLFLTVVITKSFTTPLTFPSARHGIKFGCISPPRIRLSAFPPPSTNDDDDDDDDENRSFYEDLRKAKNRILGAPIPPEEARASAEAAENEFLAAMKETTAEFESIKAERGGEGAVEEFIKRIEEEEEEEDDDYE